MEKIYVEAAIFDLDGTLIDSRKDIIDSLNHTLKEVGLEEMSVEVMRGYIGMGRDRLISDALGHTAAPEMVRKVTEIFAEYYKEHMFDTTRLFPGARDVLEYLKGKTLMMVTNKNRELTVETLRRFGIEKYFHRVVGGDDTNCRKPNACPINNLLSGMNIPKDKAIMIGDSDIDVKTGKLAGIITCGLTWGIGRKEDIEKAGPDYLLDDIRKVKDIIC